MEFIREVLGIISQYYSYLLSGIGYTMLIALIGTAAGFLIGLLTGVIRTAPKSKNAVLRALHKIVNAIIAVYIEVFRGTPMMVQAMVIYWGYAFLNDGIISVDRGQLEGAYSVGMTHGQAMVKVVIPQVLQNILPSISNEFVINIKDTSVLNVIGVTELYYMAGVIKRINLQTFQVYTVICILYFILTFTVTRLLRLAEKKLAGSDNYTICGSGSDSQAEIHIREAQ